MQYLRSITLLDASKIFLICTCYPKSICVKNYFVLYAANNILKFSKQPKFANKKSAEIKEKKNIKEKAGPKIILC